MTVSLPSDWGELISIIKNIFQVKEGDKISIDMIADFSTLMSSVYKISVVINNIENTLYIKKELPNIEPGIIKREYLNLLRFGVYFNNKNSKNKCVELEGISPNKTVLLLKECLGDNFFNLIEKSCSWSSPTKDIDKVINAARVCGKWLKYLETSSKTEDSGASITKRIENEFTISKSNLNQGEYSSFFKPLFDEASSTFHKLSEQVSDHNNVYLAHGDFHPGNLFIDHNENVSAIDFQHVNEQFEGYDKLYFELLLELSFGFRRYNPWKIKKVHISFLEGYGDRANIHPLQKKLLKAQIAIKTLVFLNSIFETSGPLSRLMTYYDIKKTMNWLRAS